MQCVWESGAYVGRELADLALDRRILGGRLRMHSVSLCL
jgi:hypothetical protein